MLERADKFTTAEIEAVLKFYSIGKVFEFKPLMAGNARSPKVVLLSEKGKFLLKRRPKGQDDLNRVCFAHAVQKHLYEKAFPVTELVGTVEDGQTILHYEGSIYELFKFASGIRYNNTVESTAESGRKLGQFHRYLRDFENSWDSTNGSYHDSGNVRRHLKIISNDKKTRRNRWLQVTVETLMSLYEKASAQVNTFGYDLWPKQVVHGDWHPGNLLFVDRQIVAVLDFDTVKMASPFTDLANGMLQFSIVGNRPNPVDWPSYLDQAKMTSFLDGYRSNNEISQERLESLVDLMVEAIIAEAILPIAMTGSFGHLSGVDFLRMIHRKAEWIDKHHDLLVEAITVHS